MQPNLTYLLIDIGAFIVPFIFSFHPKIKFYQEWSAFWSGNFIITLLFLIWDIVYTKMGVWGFNEHYILGIKLFNLPIEEVLFFICIPYASIFTYHCFKLFYPKILSFRVSGFSVILIITLFMVGVLNISKIYTSVTFILLALLVADFSIDGLKWMPAFYFMYVIILLPFFIVNGILTGTGIDSPVVWYDNSENLGIRILTIPFEDIFYGMLLLLLNTFAFESFKKKHGKKKNTDISV